MSKAKNTKKMSREQRKTRTYQIIFVVVSVLVLLTMLLQLVAK
jgi:predicted nucleic acid-binding Zn ribbon protein